MNDKLTDQSKREFAYSTVDLKQYCSGHPSLSKVETATGRSRLCSVANSLYRYPSPDRPAYSPSRPITEIRLCGTKLADVIGYHDEIAIHRGAGRTNCGAVEKTMIGLRLCKRHPSSLRQWQYLVWQVALRATWNAVLQALQVALWPQKYWAQTQLAQQSLALLLACSATTLASTAAVKLDNRALHGRAMNMNRRRGHTPAAVLSFLGT